MHAAISGTVDFHEPDDESCLQRLRSLIELLPESRVKESRGKTENKTSADRLYDLVPADGRGEYDVRDVLVSIVDDGSLQEYKADFGQTLVTALAKIGCHAVGIVANQKHRSRTAGGELQIGGVSTDRILSGRARIHGRETGGASGNHSSWRQVGECGQQFHRAEINGNNRRVFRRRKLRAVWQGVRPSPHPGMALGEICRDGSRSSG
jgi:hypothetical protein